MGIRGTRRFLTEVEHQERTRRRLAALWAEGFTMSEIGRRMGITKNAVSGLRWRMGLPQRPSPILSNTRNARRKRKPGSSPLSSAVSTLPPLDPPPADDPPLPAAVLSAAVRKPKPPRRPKPPRAADQPNSPPHPAPLACLWPLNDGENKRWLFCEAPRAAGAVYCEAHCAAAYTGRVRSAGGLVNYAWGSYA
jgi:GcrA cell cycle regulator